MNKNSLLLICLIFINFGLKAQVSFSATTDARQVPLGEIFEVKFTLQNAQGQGFRAPAMSEFNVVGGPNRMNSMTMVNGSATSSETYSYVLQAKREGVFTIGAASVVVKGQNLATVPLSIIVSKGKKATVSEAVGDAKDGVFIRAEMSTHEARVGQQVILDYKLYTRLNLSSLNPLSESKYDNFYMLEVNDFTHGDNRVTIGGKPYISRILKRVALFPKKEGETVIEPLTVQIGIVKSENKDPFADPFFGGVRSENHTIQSNSVNILVKSLPNNSTASFTGGVGDYKITFGISKKEATTDDVISVKMSIVGNGDAKRWQAPKLLTADSSLVVYEPKVLREESREVQGEWQTTKEFEYLVVSKQAGKYTVTPEFTYFDTEGGQFKTERESYDLTFSQGKNATASINADRPTDIRGIKTATAFTKQINSFYGTSLFYSLAAFPFLFIGGVFGYKQILIQRSKIDVSVLKSQNAQKVSERRLAIAYEFLKKGNKRIFYDEVSKAMFTYVSDKLGIPMSEFSKSSVEEKLKSLNVNGLHIKNFVEILRGCEMALFAGQEEDGKMTAVYDAALKVIVDIEEDLK